MRIPLYGAITLVVFLSCDGLMLCFGAQPRLFLSDWRSIPLFIALNIVVFGLGSALHQSAKERAMDSGHGQAERRGRSTDRKGDD